MSRKLNNLYCLFLSIAILGFFSSCDQKNEQSEMLEIDKKYISESLLFALNQAVEKDPDEPENYFQRSKVYFERKEFKKSLPDVEKAISLNPQGKYFLLKGQILTKLKEYEEALKVFRQAEALQVNDAELKIQLAELFLETGNKSKASQYLSEASSLTPYHPEVLFIKGKLTSIEGDTSTALAIFKSVLQKDTGNVNAYKELAVIYYNKKKYDSSMVFITAGRVYEPNDPFFLYQQGRVLQSMNMEYSAIANYETAISMDTTFAPAYHALGNYWFKKGEERKAEKYLVKELKLDPNSISSALHLADLYEKQERGQLAIPLIERVVKLDSLNKSARITLDRLYNKYPKPIVEEKKEEPVKTEEVPQVIKQDTVKKTTPVKPVQKDTAVKRPEPKPSAKPKKKDTSGENTNFVPLIKNPDSTKIEAPKD